MSYQNEFLATLELPTYIPLLSDFDLAASNPCIGLVVSPCLPVEPYFPQSDPPPTGVDIVSTAWLIAGVLVFWIGGKYV